MRPSLVILFLFLITAVARGQYFSNNGTSFELNEIKGCSPLSIIFNTHGDTPFSTNWGDGSPVKPEPDSVHTYTNLTGLTQTYRVAVSFQSGGVSDFRDIIVKPSIAPAFDIYTCNGQQVQIKVNDSNYDNYIVDFGDATAEQTIIGSGTIPHTYAGATPANYTINVRGKDNSAADNCSAAPQGVTVVSALTAPVLNRLTVVSADSMHVEFTGSDNAIYRVQNALRSAISSFQYDPPQVHNVSETYTTFSTLDTESHWYCTRLVPFDPCLNSNTTAFSNVVCSVLFDKAEPLGEDIDLAWTTSPVSPPGASFQIERDGVLMSPPGVISSQGYLDTDVDCNVDYRYRIVTTFATGGESISLEREATGGPSPIPPAAIQDVTSVVGDGVALTWSAGVQPIEYSVFRKSGSGSYDFLTKTTSQSFTDPSYTTGGNYCYRINYVDACNSVSTPKDDICPIRLTRTLNDDNTVTLLWNDYDGWADGVASYDIERVGTTPILGASSPQTDPFDPTIQVYRYIAKANAIDGSLGQSVSNELVVTREAKVNFPTAFTPNGDGMNDNYNINIPENFQYIDKFEMKIFNRWGELIFTTSDREKGWDGKYKGVSQPEGTYIFTATLTDLAGNKFKRDGSFALLRRK